MQVPSKSIAALGHLSGDSEPLAGSEPHVQRAAHKRNTAWQRKHGYNLREVAVRRQWIGKIARGAAIVAVIITAILIVLYERIDARAQLDQPRRADAIIVLGSSVLPGGRPSLSLALRIQRGIELYQAGYASHLILSGGVGNNPPSEAETMKNLAMRAGVPEDALLLEDRSHSTEENLANSKIIMDARGWRTALIVSSPYHLLRADIIARDLKMDAIGVPSHNPPTLAAALVQSWYTARESLALLWYYASQVFGEPAWLYAILKGKM